MKTHWKKAFKSDYLSSSDIEDKDLILTIKNVKLTECLTASGKKLCNVAYFTDTVLDSKGKCISGTKPMILNVGNSKIVKGFAKGETHLEDWNNIKVQIYVDAKVKFAGDTVEGLRIRTQQPKKQSELKPLPDDKFNDAVKFLKDGKTIEDLKLHYSFDLETEKRLEYESSL